VTLAISCVQLCALVPFAQYIVEAGTGIEPVYTDLQSAA
jgi:hypothetical protein